jgi:hypothetical protein
MANHPGREGSQAQKETERPNEGSRPTTAASGDRDRDSKSVQQQGERVVEVGRERQVAEVSAAAASGLGGSRRRARDHRGMGTLR